MIKASFKNLPVFLLAGAVLCAPLSVLGQAVSTTSPSTAQNTSTFCNNLPARQATFDQNIQTRITTFSANHEKSLSTLATAQAAIDSAKTANRTQWDQNIQAHFVKLNARASNQNIKQAVTVFEATVTTAIDARRSSVDAAEENFRNSVDKLSAERLASATSSLALFKTNEDDAWTTALVGCASGQSTASVRNALVSSLNTDSNQLEDSLSKVEDITSDVQSAIDTRDQAINAATTTFTATYNQAVSDLRSVFPNA